MHHGPSRRGNTLPPGYPTTPNRPSRRVLVDALKYSAHLLRAHTQKEAQARRATHRAANITANLSTLNSISAQNEREATARRLARQERRRQDQLYYDASRRMAESIIVDALNA